MNPNPYLTRIVNLRPAERDLVIKYSRKNGLGAGGFSASLRAMLQEWSLFQCMLSSLPRADRLKFASWLSYIRPEIAPEDQLLEGSGVEIEYPAGESPLPHPWANNSSPRVPSHEYETALFKMHGGKYTGNPEGEEPNTD